MIYTKYKNAYVQKKKKPYKNIFIAIILTFIAFLIIYNYKTIEYYYRNLFLSENLKYIENRISSIETEIEKNIREQGLSQFYSEKTFRKDTIKKIDDTLQTLKVIQIQQNNQKDIYSYYLTLNLLRFFLTHVFTKENLISHITREILPPGDTELFIGEDSNKEIQRQNQLMIETLMISKKLQSLMKDEELKTQIRLIFLIAEIANHHLLEPYLFEHFKKISSGYENIALPYQYIYNWMYYIFSCNFGKFNLIEKFIQENKSLYQFYEEELLLIQSYAFYYSKNYIYLLQNYEILLKKYENKTTNPFYPFVKKEFLRLLVEVFFLQKNFIYLDYYSKDLEKIAMKENDIFTLQRLKLIEEKLKKTNYKK